MTITELSYVLYGLTSFITTFVVMKKISQTAEDVQEIKRFLSQISDEKRTHEEDLVSRMNEIQNMRFSYMGRTPPRRGGNKK